MGFKKAGGGCGAGTHGDLGGGGYVHTVTNIQVPRKSGDFFTTHISDCQTVKDNVLHKASYLV